MSPRTRMIVVSHVSPQTGLTAPLPELTQLAHKAGALLLVDGAQGAGACGIDLAQTDVDFYAFPAHKWLCGPEGIGALYVNRRQFGSLQPTHLSFESVVSKEACNWTGSYLTWPDARRFEHSALALSLLSGWNEGLKLLRVTVGWDFVFTRTHGLSGYLLEKLLDLPHVRLITQRDRRAGLVSFQMTSATPEEFVRVAADTNIQVQAIATRRAVRASTGFFNNEDDVDNLVRLIEKHAAK